MTTRATWLVAAVTFLCLAGHGSAQPMAFTLDVKLVAKAEGKAVSILDAQTQKVLVKFVGHTDDVTALVFSADGKTLVSGGKDRAVGFWDVATGKQIRQF